MYPVRLVFSFLLVPADLLRKWGVYIGQIDIVTSILWYTEEKEQALMRRAEELGIQFADEQISDDAEDVGEDE